jgi:hypothetical protein
MKKIIFPVAVSAVLIAALATVLRMQRDRNAALSENSALTERLSHAEAVSAAVLKIDALYREAKNRNSALTERLAIAEAASRNCRTEFKDAVADPPRPKRQAVVPLALPGYVK